MVVVGVCVVIWSVVSDVLCEVFSLFGLDGELDLLVFMLV